MSEYTIETFIGSGAVYLAGFQIGNVTELSHTITKENKSVAARAGGGNYDSLTRITAVTLAMKVSDFNDANLALALQALKVEHAGGASTEQVVTPINGGFVPLDFLVDTSQAATVATDEDTPVSLAQGTDYTLTPSGIKFTKGGQAVDTQPVKVTYTSLPTTALEAYSDSQKEGVLFVEGINDVNGNPQNLTYHRFKAEPMGSFAPFSDDFAALEINGEVLADTTKGANKSKFLRMTKTPSVEA